MSRNRRRTGEEAIQKLVQEGRGQGELAEYQPWLTVRDVPSRGLSTHSKGWKTGRAHHLLSKLELELAEFLTNDWAN